MDRLWELIEYLESTDVSRLQRWGELGYEEFCNAIDDYCCEKDYDEWKVLLRSVAKMIKVAVNGPKLVNNGTSVAKAESSKEAVSGDDS